MKYEYLAVATAYADAKGLPYETKTKQQIIDLGGVATGLIAPDTHSPDFPDFKGAAVGSWSDDTQHTVAMMESLTKARSFNLQDLATRLKKELERSSAGWGGATKRTIVQIGEHMSDADLRTLGEAESNGCGPLMRVTPLVVFNCHYAPQDNAAERENNSIADSTTLTHHNAHSFVSVLTHSEVLKDLIAVRGDARVSYSAWSASDHFEKWFDVNPMLSQKIVRAANSHDISGDVYDNESEAFASWSVQAVVYEVFDRMKQAPFKELIDAVIAEGGDTDSTAAIAAGLWVCANPEKDPEVDVFKLQQPERLLNVGKSFAELVVSQSS